MDMNGGMSEGKNVLCLSQNSISWGFYHKTDKAWNQRFHTEKEKENEMNTFVDSY